MTADTGNLLAPHHHDRPPAAISRLLQRDSLRTSSMCANVAPSPASESQSSSSPSVPPPTAPESPSSARPSTSRALWSRLSSLSPLRSRSGRSLVDFHIRPNEPYRKYAPGDLVHGAVVLTVVKPIRITHLTVALHGFVRVFKTANAAAEFAALDTAAPTATRGKKGNSSNAGQASLFQDEVTLCGEGRLDVGVYKFNFELEFPTKGLPSSIDFERGTISYLIRATITRPTAVQATISCDRKLSLVEMVDVGPLRPPKSRTISLEPISKRPKIKRRMSKAPATAPAADDGAANQQEEVAVDDSASQTDSASRSTAGRAGPHSPVASEMQSEVSAESVVSSESTGRSVRIDPVPKFRMQDSPNASSRASLSDRTITATIEMTKSGCLPGDTLPLRITIHHTKVIRSMHGVIVTLYRQSRIDTSPPLSMFVDVKGKAAERLKHEEYYPKSKTGLGGLSLSSAGTSSVFRKDLSQTFAPLIIDPQSLSAVITSSIRVPAEAFPTISGVPGQMISFKYYVEVVIDLGGKLASQESVLPKIGMVKLPSSAYNQTSPASGFEERSPSMLSSWNGNIVDTAQIRREKSVVAGVFEVTVGTSDSSRARGRAAADGSQRRPNGSALPSAIDATDRAFREEAVAHISNPQDSPLGVNEPDQRPRPMRATYSGPSGYIQTPAYVPPPDISNEDDLPEKERLRQAEARLLPSRPPADDFGDVATRNLEPSAPVDPDADIYGVGGFPPAPTDLSPGPAPFMAEASSAARHLAPLTDVLGTPEPLGPADDKLERERQRLLAEASAPPDFPQDDDGATAPPAAGTDHAPSAPTMTEDDEFDYSRSQGLGHGHGHDEDLPAYQR